jgi:hypothetical protein
MSSAFLAQLIGSYILVASIIFLLKYESFVDYAREFAANTSLRYTIAFLELAAGLGIVLAHNIWTLGYQGVVTVIGWMMLLEAVFHLMASEDQERRVLEALDTEIYWKLFGALSIVLGFYLATLGFATLF